MYENIAFSLKKVKFRFACDTVCTIMPNFYFQNKMINDVRAYPCVYIYIYNKSNNNINH